MIKMTLVMRPESGKKYFCFLSQVTMIFSKSFGYAVRGVLYITFRQNEGRFVQVEEIASNLAVPKHFMGKILKRLVKEQILLSAKGPSGGFKVNNTTSNATLLRLAEITSDLDVLRSCVLQFRECNGQNPCPLHGQMEQLRNNLGSIMAHTTIQDLIKNAQNDFIGSISSRVEYKSKTIE